MPTKKKAEPEPFDLSSLRRATRYVWREVEREDDIPLRVKLRDLSMGETNAIPLTLKTPLTEALEHIAPYVVEWSLTAERTDTGEIVDVPPPAEVGAEVFDLLKTEEAGAILSWLKFPQQMRSADEKKESTP